ncbi:DUF4446 family protein [bacterium 1XD42-54]|jgi:hypothetical protein|nr:DUF4446 family protein [bacterium 1XD42-54]
MQSNILNSLGIDPGIIVIIMMGIMIFVLLYMVRVSMKMTRFMKRYRIFMKGRDATSLEKAFAQKFIEVDKIVELNKIHANEIRRIKDVQSRTANKIGIVKYDAFPDVGGRLSFALAMLDESDSGFVLNAIHGREGCYTYIKEIVKGESYVVLGQEEKEALRQAVNYFNDMPS